MAAGEAEGDVETAPVDVKSRIAAFSQGTTTAIPGRSGVGAAGPSSSPLKQRQNQDQKQKQQGQTPIIPRSSNPPLSVVNAAGKKPSSTVGATAQLLPPWQQTHEQHALTKSIEGVDEHSSKDRAGAREIDDDGDNNSSTLTKARVKDIIALYGQQQREALNLSSSQSASSTAPFDSASPKEAPVDDTLKKQVEGTSSSSKAEGLPETQAETVVKKSSAAPPPILPPRPRNTTLLSQTNTGSSASSSSAGHSAGGHQQRIGATSPHSTYTPYMRKASLVNESLLPPAATTSISAEPPSSSKVPAVPALPPRSWAARSTDDLSLSSTPPPLPPSHPNWTSSTQSSSSTSKTVSAAATTNNNSATRRMLGSGPKWASSSSGNISTKANNSNSNSGHTTPPLVPPRTIPNPASTAASPMTSTSSGGTLIPPPPPKRGVTSNVSPLSSPKMDRSIRRPTSGALRSAPMASSGGAATTSAKPIPINGSHFSARNSNSNNSASASASPTQQQLPSTTSMAPPPRHVDARRAGGSTAATSNLSTQQQAAIAARRARKQEKRAQREKRFAQEAASMTVEQRYSSLFDQQWKLQQQQKTVDTADNDGLSSSSTMIPLLSKRTVVRLWKRSLLEDWFLARVWTAASNAENTGVSKVAFIRAMSAIDSELARRQNA